MWMKDISHKISSESLPRSDKIRFQGCKKLMNMKWDGIIPPHTHVFWCLLVTLPWPRYLDTDDHYQLCDASWTQWMKNIMIQINPQIHGFALKSIKKRRRPKVWNHPALFAFPIPQCQMTVHFQSWWQGVHVREVCGTFEFFVPIQWL